MADICVLWDDAHLWGLMLRRTLSAFGLPARLVTGAEIGEGLLREQPPRVLVVPGGNARAKARALGQRGLGEVRSFVAAGGGYLGFCGGAGLGLTDGETSLSLCPWCRKPFTSRMQHLVSGFMRVLPGEPDAFAPAGAGEGVPEPEFPVWWPGRFAPREDDGVTVLARYGGPGSELWVADIRLDNLPVSAFDDWQAEYGLTLWPSFMQGQPCLVRGQVGAGDYVLSYAHLETPGAPEANRWLAHILSRLLGRDVAWLQASGANAPVWDVAAEPVLWDDSVLARAWRVVEELVRLGQEHFLLFERTPWLIGWRRGLPGLQLNALRTLVRAVQAREPGDEARRFWAARAEDFARDLDLYGRAVTGYLLAERLDMTLSHSPGAPAVTGLADRRAALFGPPQGIRQAGGGLHARLQGPLEELARLLLTA